MCFRRTTGLPGQVRDRSNVRSCCDSREIGFAPMLHGAIHELRTWFHDGPKHYGRPYQQIVSGQHQSTWPLGKIQELGCLANAIQQGFESPHASACARAFSYTACQISNTRDEERHCSNGIRHVWNAISKSKNIHIPRKRRTLIETLRQRSHQRILLGQPLTIEFLSTYSADQ